MILLDGVNKKHLCICLTLFLMLKTVLPGSVTSLTNNIEANFNETVNLKWSIIYDKDSEEKIPSIWLFVLKPPFTDIIQGHPLTSTVSDVGKKMFGDRLSGSFSDSIYTVTIKNIQFNDNRTFRLDVIFLLNEIPYLQKSILVIKQIIGGPNVCGISLNSSYIVHEEKQLSVSSEVCGNPKPVVTWKLEKEIEYSNSTNVAHINISSIQYRYAYKTRLITREDCGEKIVFNATGANGIIKGETLIDVTFSPRKVQKAIFYRDNDCINGILTREATGKCALNYHLQFEGGKDIFNTTDTYYAVCNVLYASSVLIWASYRNKYGQKTKVNTSLTTIAPQTKTTDACKRTIFLEVKSLDTKKLLVTIIITLVVTQIANICIYGVLKLRGTGCNCRNKQSVKKDDENKDGQDYEVFPTTESHYTGLQLEARKETVYADLSPTTVSQ